MSNLDPYKDFTNRLKLLISKHPQALVSSDVGHAAALGQVQADIARLKQTSGLAQ